MIGLAEILGSWPRELHGARSPHPVPLPQGEGTVLHARSAIQASLLHPHPLADADTLICKLAKASLRGEGQDEG